MQLPTMIAWLLMLGSTFTGDQTTEPIAVDKHRALEIAANTDAVLRYYRKPVYKASEHKDVWYIRVMDRIPTLGGHCWVVIDKRTGTVLRVVGGK